MCLCHAVHLITYSNKAGDAVHLIIMLPGWVELRYKDVVARLGGIKI